MTGLIILTFIPFVAAVAFWIRTRGEQKKRSAAQRRAADAEARAVVAEQRARDLDTQLDRQGVYRRELFPVIAHELRSPLAAILGYEELLEDGVFGSLDERGIEALLRIRLAAAQLITLVDGIDRLGGDTAPDEAPGAVPAADIIDNARAAVQVDADARGTTLTTDASDAMLHTRSTAARTALTLALGAAVKVTPGGALHIATRPHAIIISGSRLDPVADDPALLDHDAGTRPLTGAGLRLAFAHAAARVAAGSVSLSQDGTGTRVVMDLPALSD